MSWYVRTLLESTSCNRLETNRQGPLVADWGWGVCYATTSLIRLGNGGERDMQRQLDGAAQKHQATMRTTTSDEWKESQSQVADGEAGEKRKRNGLC